LIGLGYGTFMSNGQSDCFKVCEPHRIGIGLSTYFIGLDIGLGIGPYIMGEIHLVLSFLGIYFIAGAIAFICVFIYMFLS
ncbi:MFS transporter, partial [Listeria monocytogenes]|nr:MFS transporter [Listeria monocytogenes]